MNASSSLDENATMAADVTPIAVPSVCTTRHPQDSQPVGTQQDSTAHAASASSSPEHGNQQPRHGDDQTTRQPVPPRSRPRPTGAVKASSAERLEAKLDREVQALLGKIALILPVLRDNPVSGLAYSPSLRTHSAPPESQPEDTFFIQQADAPEQLLETIAELEEYCQHPRRYEKIVAFFQEHSVVDKLFQYAGIQIPLVLRVQTQLSLQQLAKAQPEKGPMLVDETRLLKFALDMVVHSAADSDTLTQGVGMLRNLIYNRPRSLRRLLTVCPLDDLVRLLLYPSAPVDKVFALATIFYWLYQFAFTLPNDPQRAPTLQDLFLETLLHGPTPNPLTLPPERLKHVDSLLSLLCHSDSKVRFVVSRQVHRLLLQCSDDMAQYVLDQCIFDLLLEWMFDNGYLVPAIADIATSLALSPSAPPRLKLQLCSRLLDLAAVGLSIDDFMEALLIREPQLLVDNDGSIFDRLLIELQRSERSFLLITVLTVLTKFCDDRKLASTIQPKSYTHSLAEARVRASMRILDCLELLAQRVEQMSAAADLITSVVGRATVAMYRVLGTADTVDAHASATSVSRKDGGNAISTNTNMQSPGCGLGSDRNPQGGRPSTQETASTVKVDSASFDDSPTERGNRGFGYLSPSDSDHASITINTTITTISGTHLPAEAPLLAVTNPVIACMLKKDAISNWLCDFFQDPTKQAMYPVLRQAFA